MPLHWLMLHCCTVVMIIFYMPGRVMLIQASANASKPQMNATLLIDVTLLQEVMIILYMPGPVMLILGHGKLQPRFHISVVMYHSCTVYFTSINTRIIAQAQDMPRLLERVSQVVKSYEAWG